MTISIPERNVAIISSGNQDVVPGCGGLSHGQDLSVGGMPAFRFHEVVIIPLFELLVYTHKEPVGALTFSRPWLVPQRILSVVTRIWLTSP